MAPPKQEFLVREAQEPDVEGMRVALWEAFQHELPRTRPLALEDPAGFAAETVRILDIFHNSIPLLESILILRCYYSLIVKTARTLSTIRDAASPFKWLVATPSESGGPNAIAGVLLWERVANANAAPFARATAAPWGGPAQAAAHNAFAVAYRAAVGVRPHFGASPSSPFYAPPLSHPWMAC
jgi:hypothetical protein